ncbi:MAG TPA: iron-containing alcohol dehydrogenase [Bryobacteraceae bacterium]|nr:iron-containing alcohol dehydrogenase [Bryobacteraceae bacterium]HPT27533.1 iron-containing alcohol dehydrogenase [Bryobacteraceae bacterium]
MQNFEFYNPTKILFGKGQIAAITNEVPAGARVLLTAGGGSIKANGVYDQTIRALAGHTVVEFWGIEPNPEYATLMKAVELARNEKIDFILALGGGSVLDGSKFVAAAIPFEGEPWDFVNKRAPIASAMPLGSVLTLPATGSESNTFGVISRRETGEKLAFSTVLVYPKFAVLDPETTFSLPPRQVANGVVDAFCHVCEQYMTFPSEAHIQDRFAESILRTLIEVGPKTLANPANYDDRATFVWSATLALNGLIGAGVPQDWATHMIGHELTALYGIDHARTLAVVMPHLFRVQSAQKEAKLLQFADRVWGITNGSKQERIEAAIAKTEEFFEAMGLPTRLSRYENIQPATPSLIAEKLKGRGFAKLGEKGEVGPEQVVEILTRSLVA